MRHILACVGVVATVVLLTGCCACDADPCACGGLMCTAPCATNPCGCDLDPGPVGEVPTWAKNGLVTSVEPAPPAESTAPEGS